MAAQPSGSAAGRLCGHKYYGDMLKETPVFPGVLGGASPHNN